MAALVVGRSLGDAFAWFFYRKSQTMIAPHLRHRPITHIPTGVGGQAELAFLSRIRDAGYVVIYHGITSFLRIGDLSFLDLRSGEVVALGELKARKVKSGEMEVTLHMIGTDRNRVPFSSADVVLSSSRLEDPEVPKDFVQRLERQICEMRGALNMSEASQPSVTPADNSEPSSVYDAHEVGALKSLADTLEKSDVAYEQAGSGLLLVGLNVLPERSLSERLFGAGGIDFTAPLKAIVEHAVRLVHFKSRNNSIRLGEIATGFLLGCSPAFWLPVDLRFLHKLYFQAAVVQTIYNPAHLLERFRDIGFTVTQSEDGATYQIEKVLPSDRRFVLEHSTWFLMAIQGHLLKEEKVVECVVDIMNRMEHGSLPSNTKVQMAISTHVFPKSSFNYRHLKRRMPR